MVRDPQESPRECPGDASNMRRVLLSAGSFTQYGTAPLPCSLQHPPSRSPEPVGDHEMRAVEPVTAQEASANMFFEPLTLNQEQVVPEPAQRRREGSSGSRAGGSPAPGSSHKWVFLKEMWPLSGTATG